ncbi:hypothetical protein M885DRAFT_517104 [Pelagophyceae sp. CCMP2097]|nr:hypothetical protein M885DRAFT_517104 [Pelagophyceae sp. CCMP2097]
MSAPSTAASEGRPPSIAIEAASEEPDEVSDAESVASSPAASEAHEVSDESGAESDRAAPEGGLRALGARAACEAPGGATQEQMAALRLRRAAARDAAAVSRAAVDRLARTMTFSNRQLRRGNVAQLSRIGALDANRPFKTTLADTAAKASAAPRAVVEPPGTPEAGSTFASRAHRRAQREKRRCVDATDDRAPYCAAQRPLATFEHAPTLNAKLRRPRRNSKHAPASPQAAHRDDGAAAKQASAAAADADARLDGAAASLFVWRSLWTARRRRGEQEKRGVGTLPAFDGFAVSDAVVFDRGEPKRWLFSDAATGRLLRKASAHVLLETVRARCVRVAAEAGAAADAVAEAHFEDAPPRRVGGDAAAWEALRLMPGLLGLVVLAPGARLLHEWRHDSMQTKCLKDDVVLGAATRRPLRSAVIKRQLDEAVRHLVRAIEAGHGRRVKALTTLWVLDDRKREPAVADDGDEDYDDYDDRGPAARASKKQGKTRPAAATNLRLERATSVVLFDKLAAHGDGDVEVASEAGLSRSSSALSTLQGVWSGRCHGGLCGYAQPGLETREADDDDDVTVAAPAAQRGGTVALSTIAAAKRDAAGAALDFWPHELIEWCLDQAERPNSASQLRRANGFGAWARPMTRIVFPNQHCGLAPGQAFEARWVTRGPPEANVEVYLEIVSGPSNAGVSLGDEFISPRVSFGAAGATGRLRCDMPVDVNGSNTRIWWRLIITAVTILDDGESVRRRPLAQSEPFLVDKARIPYDRVERAAPRDAALALAALRVACAAGRADAPEPRGARQYDTVVVCRACYGAYAELARRRAKYDAPAAQKQRASLDHEAQKLARGDGGAHAELRRRRDAADQAQARRRLESLAQPRKADDDGDSAAPSTVGRVGLPSLTQDSAFLRSLPGAASRMRRDTEDLMREAQQYRQRILSQLEAPAFHAPDAARAAAPNADAGAHAGRRLVRALEDPPRAAPLPDLPPPKRRPREEARQKRSYADLLHPYQRLIREQIALGEDEAGPPPPRDPFADGSGARSLPNVQPHHRPADLEY